MKFREELGCDPGRKRLDFGGDPDSVLYPGSFYKILYISR